jgi:hypothetical protein
MNITRFIKDTPNYNAGSSKNCLTQSTNFTSVEGNSEDAKQVRHSLIGPIRHPLSRFIPLMKTGDPLDPEPKENSKNGIVGVTGVKNHKKKIFLVGAGPDDRSHRKPQPMANKRRSSLKEGTIAAYNNKHNSLLRTAPGKSIGQTGKETGKSENAVPLVIVHRGGSFKVRSQKQTD